MRSVVRHLDEMRPKSIRGISDRKRMIGFKQTDGADLRARRDHAFRAEIGVVRHCGASVPNKLILTISWTSRGQSSSQQMQSSGLASMPRCARDKKLGGTHATRQVPYASRGRCGFSVSSTHVSQGGALWTSKYPSDVSSAARCRYCSRPARNGRT